MMKASIKSQLIAGADQVLRTMDRLDAAANDLSPVWPEIGRLWERRQRTVFATNGLGAWPLEAATTIRTNVSPLVDTGIMRDGISAATPIWSGKMGAAWGAPKSNRRVWNVAVLHAVGTKRMPKRMPVPSLRAAESRVWVSGIEKHLRKAMS